MLRNVKVKNCRECNILFEYQRKNRFFCTQKCADSHRYVPHPRQIITVACAYCGKTVRIPPSKNDGRPRHCNELCAHKSLLKGDYINCSECNKKVYCNPFKLKVQKTCSLACSGRRVSRLTEERNKNQPPSKGVLNRRIRYSKRMDDWRISVFERDNYTCVMYGVRNGNGKRIILNADHIKPFATHEELRFELSNGRTLCVTCHRSTPTWGRSKVSV